MECNEMENKKKRKDKEDVQERYIQTTKFLLIIYAPTYPSTVDIHPFHYIPLLAQQPY